MKKTMRSVSNLKDKQEETIVIIYQRTESFYMKELGLYKVTPIAGEFGTVNLNDLATFHPMQANHIIRNSGNSK